MKKSQSQSGFSLSEVLIVVAILVILIGAVVGFGKHLKRQAQGNLCECTIGVLIAAIEQYHDWDEVFPDQAVNLYEQLYSLPKSRAICQQLESSLLGNTNLEFLDPWGKPFDYLYDPSDMTFPVVESGGPDGDLTTTADNISSK